MSHRRKTARTGIVKAHKIALDPTSEQAVMFSRCAGYARVAQNRGLDIFREGLDRGEWLSSYDIAKLFNAEKYDLYEWCRELPQYPAKYAIKDNLDQGVRSWGDYCKEKKAGNKKARRVGFPRYKKYRDGKSFRIDDGPNTVSAKGKKLKTAIGIISMREEVRFAGSIRRVHIKKEGRRWFAVLIVETLHQYPEKAKKEGFVFGIDMGIRVLATIFNSSTQMIAEIPNLRLLASYQKKLRHLNKKLSRSLTTHGSQNRSVRRDKTIEQINHTHSLIRRMRSDLIHKATTDLVMSAREIRVETLNIAGMMRNSRLARSIQDACMGEFLRVLEYKCKWHGVKFVKIDRWYPSSQICSGCGGRQKLSLSCETYRCPNPVCLKETPRDWNAAINIAVCETTSGTDSAAEADKNFTLVETSPLLDTGCGPSSDGSSKRSLRNENPNLSPTRKP